MKKISNKQYVVLGLEIFGSAVAKALSSYNYEVTVLSNDEKYVDRIADIVTQNMMCDITGINQLHETGVQNCDIVIISMGGHLEESVMDIINLEELGVPYIMTKTKNKRYTQTFTELGADKVVRPEKETGGQVTKGVLGKNTTDVVDLDKEYNIVGMPTPPQWVGKSLVELDLHRGFGINVVGIRSYLQGHSDVRPDAEYKMQKKNHLVVAADCKTLDRFGVLDQL